MTTFPAAPAQAMRREHETPTTGRRQSENGEWLVLATVAIGAFMANLDTSIVNIGLPTIANAFGVPPSGAIEWIIIAYLLAIAALLVPVGRLADSVGRKRIWMTGLTLFSLGSMFCGAAPTLLLMVLARSFQGVGAAMIMTLGPALLTQTFPSARHGRALGGLAVAVALGASIGPSAGGFITAHLSWRWIFWVNLPIGVIGLGASAVFLPKQIRQERQRFDLIGSLLLGAGLVALTLGLSFGQQWGWISPRLLATLAVGIVMIAALIRIERHTATPLISASLLRNRAFLTGNVSLILGVLGLFAVSFMMPFYLEALRHFSTIEAGVIMSALPLTLALVAPISGALADRFGTRWLAAGGLALASLGLLLLSRLDAHASLGEIILSLVITGIGQGMFQAPNNSAIMGAAPRNQQASAGGILATGRVVGQSLSVAVAGAIFAASGGALAGQALLRDASVAPERLLALREAFLTGFQAAFLACAALVAIGCLVALSNGNAAQQERPRHHAGDGATDEQQL